MRRTRLLPFELELFRLVGLLVGFFVGFDVGADVGAMDGTLVGAIVGTRVGLFVGAIAQHKNVFIAMNGYIIKYIYKIYHNQHPIYSNLPH